MKYSIFTIFFTSLLALAACSRSSDPLQTAPKDRPSVSAVQGEIATPSFEGDLIKVNNRLCAVSRTPMDEKTLGAFKGQVAYEGTNPKYQGKIFEFNYCCGMCQKTFPDRFKRNPDEILSFHGL